MLMMPNCIALYSHWMNFLLFRADALSLFDWAIKNDMVIAIPKCVHLHIGNKCNPKRELTIDGTTFQSPDFVRDLGVIIDTDLTFDRHIRSIVHKASTRLSVIRRSFNITATNFRLQMYRTFVRPLLEDCTCIWSPHTNIHLNLIESIQRKFSKYLPNLVDTPYTDRCNALCLEPLFVRRIKTDMIMLFKIVRGFVHHPIDTFVFTGRVLHNHHIYNICRFTCAKDVRLYSFHPRVVPLWNALSVAVVTADTLECFSDRLSRDPAFVALVSSTMARLRS